MKKNRDSKKKEQNGTGFFDPMAVTWTEKYDKQISKVWNVIPDKVAKIIATIAVFLLGISINGNVFMIIIIFGFLRTEKFTFQLFYSQRQHFQTTIFGK